MVKTPLSLPVHIYKPAEKINFIFTAGSWLELEVIFIFTAGFVSNWWWKLLPLVGAKPAVKMVWGQMCSLVVNVYLDSGCRVPILHQRTLRSGFVILYIEGEGFKRCLSNTCRGAVHAIYSLHPVLIDIFLYGTMTKGTKCAYKSNKCYTDFLLVLQYFNWKLLVTSVFIATTHANSKYSYHCWTFEYLKYIYQNWMEGVSC